MVSSTWYESVPITSSVNCEQITRTTTPRQLEQHARKFRRPLPANALTRLLYMHYVLQSSEQVPMHITVHTTVGTINRYVAEKHKRRAQQDKHGHQTVELISGRREEPRKANTKHMRGVRNSYIPGRPGLEERKLIVLVSCSLP